MGGAGEDSGNPTYCTSGSDEDQTVAGGADDPDPFVL